MGTPATWGLHGSWESEEFVAVVFVLLLTQGDFSGKTILDVMYNRFKAIKYINDFFLNFNVRNSVRAK